MDKSTDKRLRFLGVISLVMLGIGVAHTQENATPVEITDACNSGRSDTTTVVATVDGNQATYFFSGEGTPTSGLGGQCVATFMGFIREGHTVTIP